MSAHGSIRVRTRWRNGPAALSDGPFLISYTEFMPHTLLDLPAIYRASRRLVRACGELEGSVGLTTYWQPLHGRAGSVSVWESRGAMRSFVTLPYHLEIMRHYRSRGSLRAVDWWADSFDLARAFADGQRALDTKQP